MNALDRVYYFHELVRKNLFPGEEDIENMFDVTRSTAKKDITYLKERLLAPLKFDESRGGYAYESMFRLPFESNPRFLFFMSLVNRMIKDSGLDSLPEVQTIADKTQSLLPKSYRNVLDYIWTESIEIEYVDPDILGQIIEALHLGYAVEFVYHSVKNERSERLVDPWRLMNYQGRWYLIGYCQKKQGKRHFHCSRMRKLRVSSEKRSREIPANLEDMERGFGIFKGETTRDVRIFFKNEAATVVKYQIWHKEQFMESVPGGMILTLPVADEREIMMKIMQYGSNARVLEPESLRTRIYEEALAMAKDFEENPIEED